MVTRETESFLAQGSRLGLSMKTREISAGMVKGVLRTKVSNI